MIIHYCSCNCGSSEDRRDYSFYGSISRKVLENYLSRSITMSDMFMPMGEPYLEENIRMLTNIGAKFVGRTILVWASESQITNYFTVIENRITQVHNVDDEIILQGAIFEIITADVENLPIPEWVFEEFDLPVEQRNFDYEAMLCSDNTDVDFYGQGESVPDITQLETRLWFFYLAKLYIDMGIEAIHLGQFEWMSQKDTDSIYAESIVERIHNYAKNHARRRYVLLDAHTSGMAKNGYLLLDFHSSPMRMKELDGSNSNECILEFNHDNAIYGRSQGGITPSGWTATYLPYLVEIDHGYAEEYSPGQCPKDECIWGYDEITWFALLAEDDRNDFLIYAWNWVRENDPNGFVEMPGMRDIQVVAETNIDWYFANSNSTMQYGYNQEETIKEIWSGDK